MAKAWYEEDDNESVWWKATKKNAHNLCPDFLLGASGVGINIDGMGELFNLGHSLGWQTSLSTVWRAGTNLEKSKAIAMAGFLYCGGAYVGGGLDAWYQMNHQGMHLGTMIDIGIEDWWNSEVHGVEDFITHAIEWWRHE